MIRGLFARGLGSGNGGVEGLYARGLFGAAAGQGGGGVPASITFGRGRKRRRRGIVAILPLFLLLLV